MKMMHLTAAYSPPRVGEPWSAGGTMTVGELVDALQAHDPDLPVLFTWETIHVPITPARIQVEKVDTFLEPLVLVLHAANVGYEPELAP